VSYVLVDEITIAAGETYTRGWNITDDLGGLIDPTGMTAVAKFVASAESDTFDLLLSTSGGGLEFVSGNASTPTAVYMTISSTQTEELLSAWARRRGTMFLHVFDVAGRASIIKADVTIAKAGPQ
jgi:hypothetical protein